MTEINFIRTWKSIDFSTYNESDVREEFITQLLSFLGYSKNTIHDITREKSLVLSQPYIRLGRKQVRVDYVPSIRLKSFWILEAKPGSVPHMSKGDLLQAYLYATHPEIQAQYIVLCNGCYLEIYDAHQVEKWDVPFFSISQENCEEKLSELEEILSAKTMLATRRKRLLEQIHNTFEVELDIKELDAFYRELHKMEFPLRKKIDENVRDLQREAWQKRNKDQELWLQSLTPKQLIQQMRWCGPRTARLHNEYVRRIESSSPMDRGQLLQQLNQTYYGRPRAEFQCDCLAIYLKVVSNGWDVTPVRPMSQPPHAVLLDIVKGNLTYHTDRTLQNALDYLDRVCCRFAYLTLRTSLMASLTKETENKKTRMDIEDLLLNPPSVARDMVSLICLFSDLLWRRLSCGNDSHEIWSATYVLLKLLDRVEGMALPQYPDGDGDLLWYDSYGDKFDYLFRVSYMILQDHRAVMETLNLEEDISAVIALPYEKISEYTPKLPKQITVPTAEEFDGVLLQVLAAAGETARFWGEARNQPKD